MYRCKIKSRNIVERVIDKSQLHRVCKVDQFQAKDFNRNDFGWASNSIAAMAKAATYSQFMAIAQQISQSPSTYNLPKSATVKDAIVLCHPRMAQSPAELDMWAQSLAASDMEKLNDAYEKALKKPIERIKETASQAASETNSKVDN